VPVLTDMIAEACCNINYGPHKDFSMSDEDKYELNVAGWLHDCGKITTPEAVVDKGTKLETIRNKDWETAIANYKVLAAEGDTEASMELGTIYELQGDNSAAYTAYERAAESEDNDRISNMAAKRIKWFDRKGITGDEEIDQANQLMEESSQISGSSTVKNTHSLQYKPVTTSLQLGANPPIKPVYHIQSIKPRVVKVTLERISNIQHFKPEKFLRTPKS